VRTCFRRLAIARRASSGDWQRRRVEAGGMDVGLLTGGGDRPYALGMVQALAGQGIGIDLIGSDELDCPDVRRTPGLTFLNLRGDRSDEAGLPTKIARTVAYYVRLVRYAATARPRLFHILWNNRLQLIDRTAVMLYYKALGKKVVLTAHNVNSGLRDGDDSALNRLSLRAQYRLSDHIFVHTEQMKTQLRDQFGVPGSTITVIPFGLNETVPNTPLSRDEARHRLGIDRGERVILFFGKIAPYKGLDCLLRAFQEIVRSGGRYRLVVAGKARGGQEAYLDGVQKLMDTEGVRERILRKLEFIPDEHTEIYFKAADVLVLPYRYIFQSGVLFLAYSFGLPVIATDVGALREDIVEGRTGFLCKPDDPGDLAATIEAYFESGLFKGLADARQEIREHASRMHSWDVVGERVADVYSGLLAR
jgi:D-inositol-3-phosphate glycosyltransferase